MTEESSAMNHSTSLKQQSPDDRSSQYHSSQNCVTPGDIAPLFRAEAIVNSSTTEIRLSDYKGKWVVLFFYASDFTFVWPTELAAVAVIHAKLQQLGAQVIAISTDSIYSHKVFLETSPSMRHVEYPLVSDRNQQVTRSYGVLNESKGVARRCTVIVNPEGVVESTIVYPGDVGRYVPETVRLIEGLQFERKTGLGVPANWLPGMPGVKRDIKRAGQI